MAQVIEAIGTGWTKTVRNRKHHAVSIHASGNGKSKSLRLTLVRDAPHGQEQMQLVIPGDGVRALAGLLQRVLASDADCVTDFTPFEHLGPPPEVEQPPVGHRDNTGAAHHLK